MSVSSPTVKLETIIASGNPEHVVRQELWNVVICIEVEWGTLASPIFSRAPSTPVKFV